ncbi:Arc family DNA-binding protein [Affinirhizobium pseudoryzae]|uniref:Arc family DNA-binding protein n=1 Tax=Allorhizobium pseudoryzae TaxID=379684 RepID=UPI0013EB3D84|nr:Arc family DNA-binding protein [Allorhizobium pseudoryzae]
MKSERETYFVRMPDGLRSRIKEEAERNQRSMNAEIVFHLHRAMFDPLENEKADAPRA